MSDMETPVDSGEAPAVDPAEATTETPASDGPVSREEYEKLQDENRKYRERWKPYEQAFKDFDDADRDFIIDWLPTFKTDQSRFVAVTQQILEKMTPAEQAAVDEAVTEATEEKGSALTAEQVAEIVKQQLAERDKEAAINDEVARVKSELKELAGIDDPQSPEGRWILHLALTQTNNDIAKAVELNKQREQQIIDQFLESKGQGPTLPPKGSAAAPVKDEPKNIREASKMAHAAFESRLGR